MLLLLDWRLKQRTTDIANRRQDNVAVFAMKNSDSVLGERYQDC